MPSIEEIANNLDFDIEDVTMLIDMFIQSTKESLEDMQNGISTNNFDLISSTAHAIKGSALNMTFTDISALAQKIEQLAKNKEDIDYKKFYDNLNQQLDLVEELRIPYAL